MTGVQTCALPIYTWQRGGVRPANHPHRRLGTAAALVRKHPNLFDNVIGALETGGDPATLFTAVRDPYWNNHFTLGGKRAAAPVQLVGPARAQELMVNVVLPFAAAHAAITDNPGLAERCLDRYRTLGRSSSNATLRLAAQQLFDSQAAARRVIRTACQQQGLLQVFHDFCLQDKSGCEQCQFPALASHWGHGSPATADR